MKRFGLLATAVGAATLATVALAPAATATPAPSSALRPVAAASSSLGTTTVTTAPGIASTFLRAGILPLPQPGTGFSLSLRNGLQVSYGFPITRSTANLTNGTGDIYHSGGINFVSFRGSLGIGNFDISLADATVYATRVNRASAKVATLLVDLSHLRVSHVRGDTVLSGIELNLAPAAAGALNATFGLSLPTDGSLAFGTATIVLKG